MALTWRQLFIRMDLEEHLLFINFFPDFATFYDKLRACKHEVSELRIPIFPVPNLKSGYHYLTAMLSTLTSLQHVEFFAARQDPNASVLPFKAVKSIQKGFANFKKNGGCL